jgi:putative endonuclease
MTQQRRRLGTAGEEAVASWYEARGYEVLIRNWRCREGELDLVLRDGRKFVFCEVKTRTTDAFGAPVEAVTRTKQMRVRRLAARWLETKRRYAHERSASTWLRCSAGASRWWKGPSKLSPSPVLRWSFGP